MLTDAERAPSLSAALDRRGTDTISTVREFLPDEGPDGLSGAAGEPCWRGRMPTG
jgi:hypothetical protein